MSNTQLPVENSLPQADNQPGKQDPVLGDDEEQPLGGVAFPGNETLIEGSFLSLRGLGEIVVQPEKPAQQE